MPYASREALPERVRAHLPPHAQDIFVGAFNNAIEAYGSESSAFRVAWAAVKKQYRKQGDVWVPRDGEASQ